MSDGRPKIENSVVVGNVYDKYNSKNPIGRALMRGFLSAFQELLAQVSFKSVHEIGCGEGHLTKILAARTKGPLLASDISLTMVQAAERAVGQRKGTTHFKAASIYDLDPSRDGADLIVCCEVLEHLPDPVEAVEILKKLMGKHLLISVPREPIWRLMNMARGRYISEFGNTPGHLNHWSKRGFIRMLSHHFEIQAVRSPLPWTMVLCSPKR